MRNTFLALVVAVLTPNILGAQTASPSDPQPPASSAPEADHQQGKGTKLPLTLTGCVAKGDGDQYTVSDLKNGTYRVKGVEMKPFVGKRVQLYGSNNPSQGLHIVGGLWPSPNVAAQAGDIDQVQAAIASLPGGPTHGIGEDLPEFEAKRLRSVKGTCPQS
jgi:hypothetical protein